MILSLVLSLVLSGMKGGGTSRPVPGPVGGGRGILDRTWGTLYPMDRTGVPLSGTEWGGGEYTRFQTGLGAVATPQVVRLLRSRRTVSISLNEFGMLQKT